MKVLVAGFEAQERERISSELQARGDNALCVGVETAVAMAPSFQPDQVLIPAGDAGRAARAALEQVLDERVQFRVDGDDEPAQAPEPEVELVAESQQPVRRREMSLTAPDLASKLEQVRFADYHSILEITPGASAFLVREHYNALSRLYNPAGWQHRLSAEEVHSLTEIGHGLRDAFSILGHPEFRARYERAIAQRVR